MHLLQLHNTLVSVILLWYTIWGYFFNMQQFQYVTIFLLPINVYIDHSTV